MNTERLLVLGGVDLSPFITRDGFSVRYVPVYSDGSEFTSLDGNSFSELIGYSVRISADVEDISEQTAAALSDLLSSDHFNGTFVFPDERTAVFRMVSLEIEPFRIDSDDARFEASLSAVSDTVPLDGL